MVSARAYRLRDGTPYAHWYWHYPANSSRRPRWLRFGFTFGPAPGSGGIGKRAAVWRMFGPDDDGYGGYCLRFFHSFRRPCLTMLVQWRSRS